MSKTALRNLGLSLLLIISAGSVFGFMSYRVSAEGSRLDDQIESLKEEQARERSYSKLLHIAEETISDREQLKGYYLKQESDSIDFLNQVEGLAPQAGVVIKTNTLELVTEEDNAQWIKVSFSFSGSRDRVQKFIRILELLPYVSRLTQADLKALSSTEWQADVTMQVRVLSI